MKNCKMMSSNKVADCDNADKMDELLRSIVAGPNSVQLANPAKRKKEAKIEEKPEDYAATVEKFMAIFEVAYEDDIVLNQQSKPCIHKLKKLPLLVQTLSKKKLQKTFIDHGVFTLLKNWLEPLPDGSLPNINVRRAILMILTDQFQFDVSQDFVKEQLKSSGLGKAIMFLSQSGEETASNQKLARDLVYKWSRSIYNISTRMEDARAPNVETMPKAKRPCIRKTATDIETMPKAKRPCIRKTAPVAKDKRDDLERELDSQCREHRKIAKSILLSRAQIPEPTSMTFVVSPPCNVGQNRIIANQQHDKVSKKMEKLRKKSRKSTQPIKVYLDGSIFWYCSSSAPKYSTCL